VIQKGTGFQSEGNKQGRLVRQSGSCERVERNGGDFGGEDRLNQASRGHVGPAEGNRGERTKSGSRQTC